MPNVLKCNLLRQCQWHVVQLYSANKVAASLFVNSVVGLKESSSVFGQPPLMLRLSKTVLSCNGLHKHHLVTSRSPPDSMKHNCTFDRQQPQAHGHIHLAGTISLKHSMLMFCCPAAVELRSFNGGYLTGSTAQLTAVGWYVGLPPSMSSLWEYNLQP